MDSNLVKDIIQWDVKSWSKALNFWKKRIDFTPPLNGLELGGREGGLSLWLALNGVEVVCSDLDHVEKTASILHQKYAIQKKVVYQNIDATAIPYENHFDLIVFKSVLGGIGHGDSYERQKKAMEQMYKALKPGGKLLFAENLSASFSHQFMRKKFVKWGDYWRYPSYNEMNEMLSHYSQVSFETTGFCAAFGRSERQRRILATVDLLFFNWIIRKQKRYILYGIAVK